MTQRQIYGFYASLINTVRRLAKSLIKAWRAMEFRGWRWLMGKHQQITVRVYDNYKIVVDTDDFRAYRIWRLGGTQAAKIALLRRFCEAGPQLFIDVGANYGEFTLVPAEMGIRCFAIEANPRLLSCLYTSLSRYPNVTVVGAAAGDREGETAFYYCPNASGSGSLGFATPEAEACNFSALVKTIGVPTHTVDTLAKLFGIRTPDGVLLKIDVEGFKQEVLAGATQLLRSVKWWRTLVEFSPSALRAAGKSVYESWHFFRRHCGFILDGPGPVSIDQLFPLPTEPPQKDVDLLIGNGSLPCPARHL